MTVSNLKDVEIVITREVARITQEGFGKPLLFSATEDEDYADCRNLADVVAAGFDATTDIYKMAVQIFRQNPSPREIAVYGGNVDAAGKQAAGFLENAAGDGGVTVTAATGLSGLVGLAGNDVEIKFKDEGSAGAAVAYADKVLTVNFGGAASITCTALVALIAALDQFEATTTTGASTFTLADDVTTTAVMGGGYNDLPTGIKIVLQELIADHNTWYFLLSDEKSLTSVEALSDVAAGNKKLYFASPDASVNNYVAKAAKLSTNRTVFMYHDEAGGENDPYAEAAWVGRCAPTDPGSITWKFKTLDGVPTAAVTTTEAGALHAGNCNTYVSKLGVPQTSEGVTTIGEYIDIARGADWVEARMSERIHHLLFTMPKVPYDNRGIGMIKGEIEAVLKWATTRGIVAVNDDGTGKFAVYVPDRADTDPVNRANRILTDVRFEFDLAGAIHTVRVSGVIKI